MADLEHREFNRSALTVHNRRAWYTGQSAERIPGGLVKIIGKNCLGLDLSYNELRTISGIKEFCELEELILDNNILRDLRTLPEIPSLTTLSLNNNKITDLDGALQKINECCPNIVYVSLLGNPGCPDQLTDPGRNDEADYERYRLYAIHCLPQSLRFLDSRAVTTRERKQARDRGQFLRTVKLAKTNNTVRSSRSIDDFDDILSKSNCTPLPKTIRDPQDHRGAFGKCRYRYSGKNSEGNRFICNNDL